MHDFRDGFICPVHGHDKGKIVKNLQWHFTVKLILLQVLVKMLLRRI